MNILRYIAMLAAGLLHGCGRNQIIHIILRKEDGIWKFDDLAKGLAGEPFVAGVPEILEGWLSQDGQPEATLAQGVGVTSSPARYPGASHRLLRLRFEMGRHVVRGRRQGWLALPRASQILLPAAQHAVGETGCARSSTAD